MKAELNINTQELAQEITHVLIKTLKPLMQSKEENNVLFTVESLAKYLDVSKQWVYERTHLKEIPYIKIGRFPRFRKRDIDKWLDSHKTPALNPLSKPFKMIK